MHLVGNWPYGFYSILSLIGLTCLPFGPVSYIIGWGVIFAANFMALTRYLSEQCSKHTEVVQTEMEEI